MTTTIRPAPATPTTSPAMSPSAMNRAARLTGMLFVITYVTSIPAVPSLPAAVRF